LKSVATDNLSITGAVTVRKRPTAERFELEPGVAAH